MAKRFELVSNWLIPAPIDAVWEVLSDAEAWPQWWPYVRAVRTLAPGDGDGCGAVREFTWRTRLPYAIRIVTEVVEIEDPVLIRATATGQLQGTGVWELDSEGDGATRVRYTWSVDLGSAWMRLIAPLASRLFRWNHDQVMRAGEAGLRRRLTPGAPHGG